MVFSVLALFTAAYFLKFFPKLLDAPLCAFKAFTGLNCPGCGLTHSFVSLMKGDISGSIRYHPMGVVIAAYLLYLFARTIFGFMFCKKFAPILGVRARWIAFHAFLIALFVNWIASFVIDLAYGGTGAVH